MKIIKPYSRKHSYTQHLMAPPEKVFPLLCPVREADWVPGWNPLLVLSASGLIEEDCIFITPDQPDDAIWVVTEWVPDKYLVKFAKVSPGKTVGLIEICLTPDGEASTRAKVTYSFTSIGEAGKSAVDGFTKDYYQGFMQEWEAALNHFLQNDTIIGASGE